MKNKFLIWASLGFALAVVSEATIISYVNLSYLSGAIEIIIWISLVPFIYRAGKAARKKNKSVGLESLRTSAWLIYWLALANGVMLFQWGLFDGTGNNVTPTSMIVLNAFMFLVASTLMYVDYDKSSSR